MKYNGKIEAKEQKVTKTNTQYFKFTIDGKFWNCFDAIVNKEFNVGDFVEFETEKKGEYENLVPETMKRINAPAENTEVKMTPGLQQVSIQKIIQEDRDSIEIGTPSKGGAIKIYGDFNKMPEFLEKVFKAKQVRDEANKLLSME